MQRFERAGYAGALAATKNPALSGRFRFWCGGSGRRYAVSVYAPGEVPPYDLAVSLYVKHAEVGPQVIAIAAGLPGDPAPKDADEVHVHLVGRIEALAFAHRDLRALLGGNAPGNAPSGAPGDNVIPFNPRRAA
ncbi:MAG: hypothetical protein KF794_13715 [Xanthobacteraceae bacterium]|nr:hypothetical protein [Xanthobacteraceae bacterium]QYK44798.1 MAG: hypothetical protein KF794_13715 [Xanthobacteraceae bacterium]